MSFIYDDPNLIELLIKSGLDFESKFAKQGQAAPAAAPAGNQDFSNINTLITNLQTKMAPPAPAEDPNASKDPNAPADISYQGAGQPGAKDPPLTSANLEGLGALVAWASSNGITVDGKRIAYDLNEDPKDEDYQLYRLEPNAGLLEVGDRSMVKQGYYANKDLLKKFIQWRQAAIAAKPVITEKVQLNKLIGDANRLLGTNISSDYKKPEDSLPLNTEIDSLPAIIDGKNPMINGYKKLFFKDIQSDTSLNAWIKEAPSIELKVGDKQIPSYPPSQEFDLCVIVRVLWTRANVWSRSAPSDKEKSKFLVYKRQMEKLAPSITGKNGRPCQLAGSGAEPASGNQAGGQMSADSINQIISTLPFATRDINFDRIKTFFRAVEPWMRNNEAANTHIAEVEDTLMQQAMTQMRVADGNIPLGESLEQFASRLIDSEKPGIYKFLITLNSILNGTRAVVENFYSARGQQINSINTAYQAKILGQIGSSPTSASTYQKNAEALRSLKADADTFKH